MTILKQLQLWQWEEQKVVEFKAASAPGGRIWEGTQDGDLHQEIQELEGHRPPPPFTVEIQKQQVTPISQNHFWHQYGFSQIPCSGSKINIINRKTSIEKFLMSTIFCYSKDKDGSSEGRSEKRRSSGEGKGHRSHSHDREKKSHRHSSHGGDEHGSSSSSSGSSKRSKSKSRSGHCITFYT